MKQGWTSLKKHKNLWIFLGILFLMGVGVGIYFGWKSGADFSGALASFALTTHESIGSYFVQHLLVLSVLFVLSFFVIGIPFAISYLFYEGITIGFCFTLFVTSFQFGGFLYAIIFFLLTKLIFLCFFLFFFSKIMSISKSIISVLVYKTNQKDRFVHYTISSLVIIFLSFVVDVILGFLSIPLLNFFSFLLH